MTLRPEGPQSYLLEIIVVSGLAKCSGTIGTARKGLEETDKDGLKLSTSTLLRW